MLSIFSQNPQAQIKHLAKSDLYAFGALMYRLLTGLSPRSFSERKCDFLFDCVEDNPKDRPKSARDLVRVIKEIQNGGEEKLAKKREQTKSYRYTDNGDGTVTDNKTGLIWLKKANCGTMTWEKGMQWAAKLAHGQCGLSDGSKAGDWRLPTKRELEAMIDERYEKPTLSNAAGTGEWKEGDAFTGVQLFYYWSSSTFSYLPPFAWLVALGNGKVNIDGKTLTGDVWSVRGGQ